MLIGMNQNQEEEKSEFDGIEAEDEVETGSRGGTVSIKIKK